MDASAASVIPPSHPMNSAKAPSSTRYIHNLIRLKVMSNNIVILLGHDHEISRKPVLKVLSNGAGGGWRVVSIDQL
jgi:hypothetical protein